MVNIVDFDAVISDADDANMEWLIVELANGKTGDMIRLNEPAINALGISVTGMPTGRFQPTVHLPLR